MGQGHSAPQPGTAESTSKGVEKKDYYELLEVEQDASPEEIKKAYRKKALELHPDRNYGNVEAATNLFAEIQSAYEVLSDPQERSWYDSHRDAFLGGDGGDETADYSYNARMTTSADILKLFSKFSPQMEFTDSQSGFYGGLRESFTQIAQEEQMACRWENIDIIEYPSFGYRDDDSQVVRQFYAVWSSFSTKKSFSWKDAYRYSEAPDRRVRRLMEKENKRLREGAIREFNEAVRSLVAFVKKRDPRYKSYRDSQAHHREKLRQSAAAQATRSRAANQAKLRSHVLQDWARPEDLNEEETGSSEGEKEHFECIVCGKTFKSENQFRAHERSKKHLKAVKQLRWEMRMQDEELDLGEDFIHDKSNVEIAQNSSQQGNSAVTPSNALEPTTAHSDEETLGNSSPNQDTSPAAGGLDPNRLGDASSVRSPEPSAESESESDDAPRRVRENCLRQEKVPNQQEQVTFCDLSQRLSASEPAEPQSPAPVRMGKAKQKRAKKAQLLSENSGLTDCTICNASFPSRNKLFSHVKLNHTRR
ncbi:putative C2H2 finger domain protein [Aspergillus lucknowensis]|uniref:DnaJ-domain-containing protein n=1 Tax=Aspergillus lucknowensis TaxID=176173 RepID=A0ABR4LK00_9EURO